MLTEQKTKKLALFGTGGFAKEILAFIKETEGLEVGIFTEINLDKNSLNDIPIVAEDVFWKDIHSFGIDAAIISISHRREFIYNHLKKNLMDVIGFVHPNTFIADNVVLGEGAIIYPFVSIQDNVRLGKSVALNTAVTLGHDVEVGDFVKINPGANVGGYVKIHENTAIGMGSNIIENVTIGENSIIGAGAVVVNDIPANSVAVGVPAKVIKKRGE